MKVFDIFKKKNFEKSNNITNDNASEIQEEKKYDFEHPFTICESIKYGNIEFYHSREGGIEIKNDYFDEKVFNKIDLVIDGTDEFRDESEKELSVKIIEKTIEKKEMILDKMYVFTLEMCNDWEEQTLDGNVITKEYIRSHFSKVDVSIWPEYSYIKNGTPVRIDNISFCGELFDIDGSELLGGHEIVFVVQGDNMFGKLNG